MLLIATNMPPWLAHRRTSVTMPRSQCTSGSAPRPLLIAATMSSDVYVADGSGTMPAAASAVYVHTPDHTE